MFCGHRSFPVGAGKGAQRRIQQHRSTSQCRRVNMLMHPLVRLDRLVQLLRPHVQALHIRRYQGLLHREFDGCDCRNSRGGVLLVHRQRSNTHPCRQWCWHTLQPTIVFRLLIRPSIVHVQHAGQHRLQHLVQQKIRGLRPLECHHRCGWKGEVHQLLLAIIDDGACSDVGVSWHQDGAPRGANVRPPKVEW